MFKKNISQILDELSIKYTKFKEQNKHKNSMIDDAKIIARKNRINERKRISKMRNKNRNQK